MPTIVNRIVIGDDGQDPPPGSTMSAMSAPNTAEPPAAPDLLGHAVATLPAVSIETHGTSGDWVFG